MRSMQFFVVGLLLMLASRAAAQSEWPDFDSPSYTSQLDPAWGVQPAGKGPPIRPRNQTFGSFDLGVPILLGDNVDRDLIRPGVNLHVQGGLDLGYVGFFMHGGWRFVPIDFDRAADSAHPQYEGEGRDPLKNPYFGMGVRAQIPNHSRVLPYISGSFDFNWWHFRDEDVYCGGYYYWWCTTYNDYEFTPGFSGRAGLAVYLGDCAYVDVGLNTSMSFEGDFFTKNQVWAEPFLGMTCRR